MELRPYLSPERIIHLDASDKWPALEKLADCLGTAEAVTRPEELKTAILKREKLLSTGIGAGVAIPHATLDSVTDFAIAMGLVPEGLPYDSLDGEPVDIILMITGPSGRRKDYLLLLARLIRVLKTPAIRDRMLREEPEQIIETFTEAAQSAS